MATDETIEMLRVHIIEFRSGCLLEFGILIVFVFKMRCIDVKGEKKS